MNGPRLIIDILLILFVLMAVPTFIAYHTFYSRFKFTPFLSSVSKDKITKRKALIVISLGALGMLFCRLFMVSFVMS